MGAPPPVVVAVRAAVDAVCAGRADAVVEHGVHDGDGDSPTWRTAVRPRGRGSEVVLRVDGFDGDLSLFVDGEYHLESLDLSDDTAVAAEVAGVCAAVLAGDLVVRHEGRRRHLDIRTSTGSWTARGGRDGVLPWGRVRDGKLRAYDDARPVAETACRVCGFDEDDDRWTGPDGGQFVICVCCAAESGVDDVDLRMVRRYRADWHANGSPWFEPECRPPGWQASSQESAIPFGWR